MKIEDYLDSLPQKIISGEDVQLLDESIREIFDLVELGSDDVFYHLGCGDGVGIEIAANVYGVKKSIGIDTSWEKIAKCKSRSIKNAEFICDDIINVKYDDATVVLFWFTDEKIINSMMKKFQKLPSKCKVITVLDPLPCTKPDTVRFPYIIHNVPFTRAENLQEQLLTVFGVKCIDFVTAWEFAERYTKAIGMPEARNDRFLTIMQSVIIWINAKNLGVACDQEMPESVKTYISILKKFFNIEVEHLLKD